MTETRYLGHQFVYIQCAYTQ